MKNAANALLDLVEAAILNRLEEGPESYEPVFSRKDRKYPYYRIYVKNYIIYYAANALLDLAEKSWR